MSSPLLRALWWVALRAGQASIAPLTIEGYLWACRSLLSVWVPSHSEEWVLRSPELDIGRASIAPLIRGSPLSMPLPPERLSSFSFWGMSSPLSRAHYRLSFWGMSSPLSRAHGWACRSLLSGGVPSHSEEWVLHSFSFWGVSSPLARAHYRLSFWGMSSPLSRAHGWTCRSLPSGGVPSHSEEWVLHSPELVIGRASIAPLTIEGHLWACRSLRGVWLSLWGVSSPP